MKLLPIKIEITEIIGGSRQTLYTYDLKINYNYQGDILGILDTNITELIKDFDLSSHEIKKRLDP